MGPSLAIKAFKATPKSNPPPSLHPDIHLFLPLPHFSNPTSTCTSAPSLKFFLVQPCPPAQTVSSSFRGHPPNNPHVKPKFYCRTYPTVAPASRIPIFPLSCPHCSCDLPILVPLMFSRPHLALLHLKHFIPNSHILPYQTPVLPPSYHPFQASYRT